MNPHGKIYITPLQRSPLELTSHESSTCVYYSGSCPNSVESLRAGSEEHAHIADTLAKLLRFISNLKTHREMSQSMSKNSKLDDEGVFGMTKFDAIPVRGAMADTALGRKRGWYEKMIHVHKQKASKGEQSSIREFLS